MSAPKMTAPFVAGPLVVAFAMLVGATAARADVTARQVWDTWADQIALYGQTLSTSGETMVDATLTISDVQIRMFDDEATLIAELGDIILTETGDGRVAVTLTDSFPITIGLTPDTDDASTIGMRVAQTGMTIMVSGYPAALTYDVSADRSALTVETLAGEIAEEVDLDVAMIAITDLAGQYLVQPDSLTRVSYAISLGALDLNVLLRETDGEGVVSGTADLANLALFANIALPKSMDFDDDMPPFRDGFAFDGGYSFGDLAYEFDINTDGDAASGQLSAAGGTQSIAMDFDGLSFAGTTREIDLSLLIPGLLPGVLPGAVPAPIEASLSRYGYDVHLPLSVPQEGSRDARLAFDLTDLAVSPVLWALIDPTEILPRDAITVAFGIDAQVTPFFDFLDPNGQEAAMMSDVPGALNAAQITALTIKGAGAEITGEGAFTFDNTDLETFDGLARPEGQMTFHLTGINAFLDSLIALGVIPQQDAMMPRMMLGMFSRPVGDDMLTTTIEVNSDGHVLANGQRLR